MSTQAQRDSFVDPQKNYDPSGRVEKYEGTYRGNRNIHSLIRPEAVDPNKLANTGLLDQDLYGQGSAAGLLAGQAQTSGLMTPFLNAENSFTGRTNALDDRIDNQVRSQRTNIARNLAMRGGHGATDRALLNRQVTGIDQGQGLAQAYTLGSADIDLQNALTQTKLQDDVLARELEIQNENANRNMMQFLKERQQAYDRYKTDATIFGAGAKAHDIY